MGSRTMSEPGAAVTQLTPQVATAQRFAAGGSTADDPGPATICSWNACGDTADQIRADAVRDHVRRLRDRGASYEAIGNAAGVGAMTVHNLMNGGSQVTDATAHALLAVGTEQIELRRIDAGGSTWRLRSLTAMGHGAARIARALGVHPETVQKLMRGTSTTVSPELAGQIRALWEAWWDLTPPRRTKAERTAATAALCRAARHNWPCPLGLDEEQLDDPGYKPRRSWRPALGRGVAPDITPATAGIRRPRQNAEQEISA
jgi:plasmid maintenance system antidote protein VapI